MKYIKTYEYMIFFDSQNKKSPNNYKFSLGDYVTCKDITNYWRENGFDENSICIVCVVNVPDKNKYPNLPYVIVPINAPDSSFEKWVREDNIEFAPEYKIKAHKYNL